MPSFAQCLLEKRHPRPNLIQLAPEYLRFSHGCLLPSTRWWRKHIYSAWVDCTAWKFVCQEGRSADFLFSFTVPLVDNSTYAWQRQKKLAPFRFRLAAKACTKQSPSSFSMQTHFAGLCMECAGNTLCIGKGFEAAWAFFCPSKPCVSLSIDGNVAYYYI